MESKFYTINNCQLHYQEAGYGSRLLVAFHGYGNTSNLFEPFIPFLEKEYKIIAVDLPHHHLSEWDESILSLEDLTQFFDYLRTSYLVEKIDLMGYSIGGRVCLSLLPHCKGKVNHCIVIASDGLNFNLIYYFITSTTLGNILFENFTKNLFYLRLIKLLHQLKFINEKKYKFYLSYISKQKDRQLLYRRWMNLSKFLPDYNSIHKTSLVSELKISLVMGKYDTIIPIKKGESFIKKVPQAKMYIVQKGHRIFDHDSIPFISKLLMQP